MWGRGGEPGRVSRHSKAFNKQVPAVGSQGSLPLGVNLRAISRWPSGGMGESSDVYLPIPLSQ